MKAPPTLIPFARQVRAVRDAQRKYFRSRTPADLEASKRLEKELDAAVDSILATPTLDFGDDDEAI